MTTPTLVKTWQYSVNTSTPNTGATSTTARNVMMAIKTALIGFGTNPWAVISSSSGAGAFASSDLWVTSANIIGAAAASNHSWIRLRQTGIATNFELCIDMNSSSMQSATIVISPSAGFVTGGTATARPTATDEIVLVNTTSYGVLISSSTTAAVVSHTMQSTDGNCTRIFFCEAGVVTGVWIFDKPQLPVTGWTNPSASVVFSGASESGSCVYSVVLASSAPFRGRGSATMNIFALCEGYVSAAIGTVITSTNDFDSSIPFFPIGMGSITASNRGRHANFFDLWMGLGAPGASGDTFPNDATKTFVLFGDIIHPWNGTTPVIA